VISTRRVYDPSSRDDGTRVLVMRLWPRGIRKDRVDVWLKELGPVVPLLRAFLDEKITFGRIAEIIEHVVGRGTGDAGRGKSLEAVLAADAEARSCGCADENRCHRSLLRAYLLD